MAAQGVKGTGRVAKGKSDTVVLAQLTVSPADTPLLMGPVETQLLTFGVTGVELGWRPHAGDTPPWLAGGGGVC